VARIEIVATDLDPHGTVAPALARRAALLGVRLTFVRGDLTRAETRARLAAEGPFDLGLFVGLSSWLPKPATLEHLRWLSGVLHDGGSLVSDCFTPDAYAVSGRHVGYKAQYYGPETYRALLDFCGFDGGAATVESGRDRINHVLVAPVRDRVGARRAA
jgi:hypothetical protein